MEGLLYSANDPQLRSFAFQMHPAVSNSTSSCPSRTHPPVNKHPLFIYLFIYLSIHNFLQHILQIEEKGTKFAQGIEIDEKEKVAVFRVPAHNGIIGADFYNDFKMVSM